MAGETVVQRTTAGHEAFRLRIVGAMHQAHEFAGDVAMEPRRPEGVLRHQPARREDDEIHVAHALAVAGRMQHQEDRRIGMVVADRTDGVETAKIVLAGRVVAVPGDDVQRRMTDVGAPQMPLEFRHQFEIAFAILESRDRREEVARVRQAIAADRPKVGQLQHRAEVLADVAARFAVRQGNRKTDAARDQGDFLRLHLQHAHLGGDAQAALLRHDQQFAVGIVEITPIHVAIGRVQVHADAGTRFGTAVAGHGEQAVDEVGRRGRHRLRIPAQLIRRHRAAIEVVVEIRLRAGLETPVHRRRTDTVKPAAPVRVSRRRKGRAGDLLGIKPARDALRRIAPDRQGVGQRLGGEFVAEAGLVARCHSSLHCPPLPPGEGSGERVRLRKARKIAIATASVSFNT